MILIKDSILNDPGYIDYIVNIISSFKEANSGNLLCNFSTLDEVMGMGLKKQLINISKEQ